MFVHFAFGGLKDNLQEQTGNIIAHILKEKRLKFSECHEFLPVLHPPGVYFPDAIFWGEEPVLINTASKPTKKPCVRYLPEKVPMICFINISLNKLKNTLHHTYYGKFGIAFTEQFMKKNLAKPVCYYTEERLFTDELIKHWNKLQKLGATANQQELDRLQKEILLYRKPSCLWESFCESVVFNICKTKIEEQPKLTLWNYDRYPLNYDFTAERECRIVQQTEPLKQYLQFQEADLAAIIVPNMIIQKEVETFLHQTYKVIPKIVLYPDKE